MGICVRYGLFILVVLCGCEAAQSEFAKKSDVVTLQSQVASLATENKETANLAKDLAGAVSAVDERVKTLKKEVEKKIDISQFEAKIKKWAANNNSYVHRDELAQFATQSNTHIGGVEQQINRVAEQVAGKLDRFTTFPLSKSQAIANCTCMHVQDRRNGQWYCWRWNNANPQATTVLLTYAKQPYCTQWVIMAPEQVRGIVEELLPIPGHIKQSGPSPVLKSDPPPPSPNPPTT